MSEPTTRQLLSTHALASAAFDYGYQSASVTATPGERMAAQQRLRPLLLADMADPLPRAYTANEVGSLLTRANERLHILADALQEVQMWHSQHNLAFYDKDKVVANERENEACRRLESLLSAEALPADPLPRARDFAARVHDLESHNRAHPGLTSGVEERERIVGEIRRLMGGVS